MRNLQRQTLDAIVKAGKTIEDIAYCNITLVTNNEPQEILKGRIFDIHKLDFMYDNGYGGQLVYGFIVFNNRSWLERQEYYGSLWTYNKQCPSEPE